MWSALSTITLALLIDAAAAVTTKPDVGSRQSKCGTVKDTRSETVVSVTTKYRRAGPVGTKSGLENFGAYPSNKNTHEFFPDEVHSPCLQDSRIVETTTSCPPNPGGEVYKSCAMEGGGSCPRNTCAGVEMKEQSEGGWGGWCHRGWGHCSWRFWSAQVDRNNNNYLCQDWHNRWFIAWTTSRTDWYAHAYYTHIRHWYRRGCRYGIRKNTGYSCGSKTWRAPCCGCQITPTATENARQTIWDNPIWMTLKCYTDWQKGGGKYGSSTTPTCTARTEPSDFCDEKGKKFTSTKSNPLTYRGTGNTRTYNPHDYCVFCEPGKISPANKRTTSCSTCGEGKHSNLGTEPSGSCKDCPAGWYAAGNTAHTKCSRCPKGQYQNEEGKGSCKKCNSGKYGTQTGQSTCKPCKAGTYTSTQNVVNLNCNVCDQGQYAATDSATSCTECAESRYLPPDVGIYHPWTEGASNLYREKHDAASDCLDCPAEQGYRTNKVEGSWTCEAW